MPNKIWPCSIWYTWLRMQVRFVSKIYKSKFCCKLGAQLDLEGLWLDLGHPHHDQHYSDYRSASLIPIRYRIDFCHDWLIMDQLRFTIYIRRTTLHKIYYSKYI